MVVGLGFLGHAGAEEHHPDVLAVGLAQHPAVRQQRRQQRGEVGHEFRHVAPDEIHRRRAGRGQQQAGAALGQDLGHAGGDFLGAQRRFRHPGKTEPAQGRDHGLGGDVGKFRHPGRGQGDVGRPVGAQQLENGKQIAADLLGVGGAGGHALAAGDAQLGHDRGPAAFHLDGLDRAVAQAAVAVLALGLDGVDGILGEHAASLWLPSACVLAAIVVIAGRNGKGEGDRPRSWRLAVRRFGGQSDRCRLKSSSRRSPLISP